MPNEDAQSKDNPTQRASDEKETAASGQGAKQPVRTVNEIIDNGRAQAAKRFTGLNKPVKIQGEDTKAASESLPPSHRGELIISHGRGDLAAADVVSQIMHEAIDHVSYLDDMDKKVGFEPKPDGPEFQLHLIKVPEGEETWKANYLQFVYKQALQERLRDGGITPAFAAALGHPDLHFNVQPNHEVRVVATAAARAPQAAISAQQFRFTTYHEQYKSMLRIPARVENPAPVTIAVLDTGVAGDFVRKDDAQTTLSNLMDEQDAKATDRCGHGTVMASIIRDVAPFARLHIFKAFGDDGRSTEWHLLWALQSLGDANIVNMSLTFGMLNEVACSECGHKSGLDRPVVYSHRVRSNAFHNQMRQLVEREQRLLVAAAGNNSLDELEYPSRFEEVIAISSVNSRCQRSSFSNGNNTGKPHPCHFALPGGETAQKGREAIGSFPGNPYHTAGTSHAAAYASGLLAHLWHRARPEERNPKDITGALLKSASNRDYGAFAVYSSAWHGQGIPILA